MRLGKKMADIINPLIVENNGDLIHITSEGERKGIPDPSRLLPDPSTLSSDSEGNVVAVTKLAADANTIRLMHFNADFSDSVTGDSPVSTTNVSLQEPGKFGKSLYFDGNPPSDFYYPALSSSPDKWTIDFWIYLTQYQNSQSVAYLIGTTLNEAQSSLLRINSDGIYVEVGYQSSIISGGDPVSLNEWHHIAVTYADNTYKCYLDGNLYGSQTTDKKVYFTRSLWIGSFYAYNGDYTMRGMIDEFRISNIVRWDSNFTPPDKEYEGGMLSYAITDPDEIMSVDAKISAHNTSLDAHPMQGATTNDYNGLDTNCSWYLSYGDNTSNVNAPANGPFFVMTKKWTNSSGSAGAAMQVAVRNMTGSLTTQEMYIRTASLSGGSLSWRTWQKVGSSAMAGIPNYGAGVDITSAAAQGGYTCTGGGWILASMAGSGETLKINGTTIGTSGRYFITVSTGDAITLEHGATYYSSQITFYPNR